MTEVRARYINCCCCGGITYGSFKKCGNNFISCIQDSILAQPDAYNESLDAEVISSQLSE